MLLISPEIYARYVYVCKQTASVCFFLICGGERWTWVKYNYYSSLSILWQIYIVNIYVGGGMRVYVYIYTYIHVNIYLCICVSMYIHVYYTNVYTCLRILMCTDIYTLSSRNNEFLIFLFSEIGILQKFVHHS